MIRSLVLAAVLLPLVLGGCARFAPDGAPPTDTHRAPPTLRIGQDDAPLPARLQGALAGPGRVDFLLLGEIHDHPLHHRLRARWLEALADQGRFVLAIEQLDADRQSDLDRARQAAQAASPAPGGASHHDDPALQLARAAGFDFRGWHWPFYAPYVELALRRGLPLVAANLSNAQARRIARGESKPLEGGRPPGWTPADAEAMAAEIRDAHCGALPGAAIAPMAAAQLARDAQIARALVDAARASGLPVVLLAGNGHVRSDLGVARHLAGLAPRARVLSVGFVEPGGPPPAFDLAVLTPVHPRPDPCEAFRAAMRPGG